jgi:hypothetical protein
MSGKRKKLVGSQYEITGQMKPEQIDTKRRHSGLDPESRSAPLDSGTPRVLPSGRLRRNDGLSSRFSMTAY